MREDVVAGTRDPLNTAPGDLIRGFADLNSQIAAVQSGQIGPRELVDDSLALADSAGETAGVFLRRFDDSARSAASDPGVRRLPLAGAPVGIKPMIAVAETPTTAQSRVHDESFTAGRDAEVVRRLRSAGAVIEGTTTMAEHAAGRPDPSSGMPIPRNPWDLDRWPGGSSCGTAIGISLGIFAAGLGTDTSGSCRIPAACCGITGLRPARGTVPMTGVLPASHSLDVVGPMARSARDCRLLLEVMQEADTRRGARRRDGGDCHADRDVVSRGSDRFEPLTRTGANAVRIGVPRQVFDTDRISRSVSEAFNAALDVFETSGMSVDVVDLPFIDELIAATLTIMMREMFEEHRRELVTRWNDFGRSFRRLAVMGSIIPDETYRESLKAAARLSARLDEIFSTVTAIALPTWPAPAPPYLFEGGTPQDEWNLTAAFSAVPHPSLALPMGFDEKGLPLSLQLVGPWTATSPDDGNGVILDLGEIFQTATDHHRHFSHVDPDARPDPVPDPDDGTEPGADLGALSDRLPEPLRRLGIGYDAADVATLLSLTQLIAGTNSQPTPAEETS